MGVLGGQEATVAVHTTRLWYLERDTAAEAQLALERELWQLECTGRLVSADIRRPEPVGEDSNKWCASAIVTTLVGAPPVKAA